MICEFCQGTDFIEGCCHTCGAKVPEHFPKHIDIAQAITTNPTPEVKPFCPPKRRQFSLKKVFRGAAWIVITALVLCGIYIVTLYTQGFLLAWQLPRFSTTNKIVYGAILAFALLGALRNRFYSARRVAFLGLSGAAGLLLVTSLAHVVIPAIKGIF